MFLNFDRRSIVLDIWVLRQTWLIEMEYSPSAQSLKVDVQIDAEVAASLNQASGIGVPIAAYGC